MSDAPNPLRQAHCQRHDGYFTLGLEGAVPEFGERILCDACKNNHPTREAQPA